MRVFEDVHVTWEKKKKRFEIIYNVQNNKIYQSSIHMFTFCVSLCDVENMTTINCLYKPIYIYKSFYEISQIINL